ncbi:hypothetical protein [Halococcus sp. AFM35]|uniref:hypothetical protein n=1 Tax=Halococcus sp. AFM35 TaxID=3421653 RepID=UPI003EBF0736
MVGESAARNGTGDRPALLVDQVVTGKRVGDHSDHIIGKVARGECCTDTISLRTVEAAVGK